MDDINEEFLDHIINKALNESKEIITKTILKMINETEKALKKGVEPKRAFAIFRDGVEKIRNYK